MKILTGALPILLAAVPVALFIGAVARKQQRGWLVPGPTSAGHHQIEERCELCHQPFRGALDQACRDCHGAALAAQNDSHAADKFLDPVRAQQLVHADATSCVACHREHKPEAHQRGSVSVAPDFCYPCHAQIGQQRESHRDFGPSTCADPGCHNYHDNRALNPELLARERGAPPIKPEAVLAPLPALAAHGPALAREDADLMKLWDAPSALPAVFDDWSKSSHARGGVNCSACHLPSMTGDRRTRSTSWKVDTKTCGSCHGDEVVGFHAGKHGMRVAAGLAPMNVALARLPMRAEATPARGPRVLDCNSCHRAHAFDRTTAALEACEACHDDRHTRSFRASPHFALVEAERAGRLAPGSGVTCASCHMPRQKVGDRVLAVHNQSADLHPANRMAREICLPCHSLDFALDALADSALITRNFDGPPRARSVERKN